MIRGHQRGDEGSSHLSVRTACQLLRWKQLQVLIADDSEFMRVAYRRILESESNLRIVAMAANGEEASKLAAETRPDVAILDVRMPKVDGIQAAHEIRRNNLKTSIVVISAYDDLAFVADLMRYGVEKKPTYSSIPFLTSPDSFALLKPSIKARPSWPRVSFREWLGYSANTLICWIPTSVVRNKTCWA